MLATDQQKLLVDGVESESQPDNQEELIEEYNLSPEVRPDPNVLRQMRIEAITRSQNYNKLENESKSQYVNTLVDDMKDLSQRFLSNNLENFVTFNIRRRHVYSDIMKKMKIFFSDRPLKRFKAEFISVGVKESGIDTGGQGRELVTLFYNSVSGQLLHGEPKNQVFIHDLLKVRNGDFFTFGQFVALALLHGYDPPHQLCRGLSGYISGYYIFISFIILILIFTPILI